MEPAAGEACSSASDHGMRMVLKPALTISRMVA
jgi:hypothetical protein